MSRVRNSGASRLFISLLIVGVVGSLAAAPSASAAPACTSSFSRDIDSYVLFAYSDLIFKGGDINGGNIGVNNDIGGSGSELTLTNVKTNMPQAGQQVVADKVASQINSTVLQDVYANSLGTFNGTVQGCGPTSLAGFGGLQIIPTANLPSLPTISPGTTDVTVDGTNSPLTLPPGQYKDLRVNDGRVLNLGNGVYHFASFSTGPGATINTVDGTDVRVAGDFSLQNQVTVTGSNLAKFSIGSTGTTHLTHFGEVHGQFFAPNGEINLEGGATLFGRFVADEIAGDGPQNITYKCVPKEGEDENCNPIPCTPTAGQDENCNPIPCVPTAGQDANCNPIPCVPTAGQDANCNPVKISTCVPKAGEDKNCNPIVTDSAKLKAPHGCTTVYTVRVSGSNIKKVVYKIDGKTVKTVKKSPFTYKLKSYKYKVGAHKLKATTYFKSGKTKSQSSTFQHCGRAAVNPHFTG